MNKYTGIDIILVSAFSLLLSVFSSCSGSGSFSITSFASFMTFIVYVFDSWSSAASNNFIVFSPSINSSNPVTTIEFV